MKKLLLFKDIHETIKAGRLCRDVGIRTDVIQTPERISAECSLSVCVEESDLKRFLNLEESANFKIKIYEYES